MELYKKTSFTGEVFRFHIKEAGEKINSRYAAVFPGNGSIEPGMFKSELKKIKSFAERFEEADLFSESVGLGKISWFITNPEKISAHLMPTIRGMVLVVVEVALFEEFIKCRPIPTVVTGHSLGEGAAMVCAGVTDFMTMVKIGHQREALGGRLGAFGAMVAISGNREKVELARQTSSRPFYIANINSQNQIVISCESNNTSEVLTHLKKNRIACRELKGIRRPFHSELMLNVSKKVKEWILELPFQIEPLKIDFVSTVNQQFYKRGYLFTKEEIATLLSDELTRPVDFPKQLNSIAKEEIRNYVEIGITDYYTSFVREIFGSKYVFTQTLEDFLNNKKGKAKENIAWTVDVKNSPALGVLTKYISKVTGYELLEISAEDNFQEDLRIDSIKKAEIIFRTLEETRTPLDESLSMSQLKRVGDVVNFLEISKRKGKLDKKKDKIFSVLESRWVEVPSSVECIDRNIEMLVISSCDIGSEKSIPAINLSVKELVFRLNKDEDFKLPEILKMSSFLNRLKTGRDLGLAPIRIWLISVSESSGYYSVRAMLKSWAKENKLEFKSIITSEMGPEETVKLEYDEATSIDVLWKNRKRFENVLLPAKINPTFQRPKVIVAIGGSRGLLFEILCRASDFVKEITIYLVGRSDAESQVVQENIRTLKKKGYGKIEYVRVDGLIKQEMNLLFENIRKKGIEIDLVVNAAGVEDSKNLENKSTNEISTEFLTKFSVTNYLGELSKEFKFQVLHFSSVVGAFGNEGQAIYAAGNAHQAYCGAGASIMWTGVEQVGMMSNVGLVAMVKSTGASLISIEGATKKFEQLLFGLLPHAPHFVLDPKDILLLDFKVRNFSRFQSSIGSLMSPSELKFERIFNLKKDSFLRDHVIEKTSVLPASYAIASFVLAGRLLFRNFPELKQFEIKNVLMVLENQEKASSVNFEINENLEVDCGLSTIVDHFRSKMNFPSIFKKKVPRELEEYNLEVNLETVYRQECIDFGPKFQVVEKAYYNSETNQIVGIGKNHPSYYTGEFIVDKLMSMLEAAFQSVSMGALIGGKGLPIPLRVECIEIASINTGKFFVVPEITNLNLEREALPVLANVSVYDEKGEHIIQIKNLEMSVIRTHQTLPFEFYEPNKHRI